MSKNMKSFSIILAIIGLLDSIYLAYIKFTHQEAICAGIGDCDVVNSSSYAEIGGFPIAIFGALGYLALLLIYIFEMEIDWIEENGVLISFGITFLGFLYSVYLTYIEIEILHAICPYCVLSAIVMTLLFFMAVIRVKRSFL